ncbi:hypothetical protein M427DRAFT_43030 [Gonapodya prolifera JEL478]|uniref:Phosphatidylserine decarboxylase n=1 Tax=Gonapodya prolifera (strain JEL478) TaxID=1344416 RepID=A0A139AKK4_GONPJ|nr:hypothetical protein M427DRAFT_43030 [Gonapodya prolifera JEL478]|eukprot:KXS17322.1 hypothetical protein M427DRAFT_43030 [Gonapodya prolifera JEL478]
MAFKTTESFNDVLGFFQSVFAWIVSGYNNIRRRETGPWGVKRKFFTREIKPGKREIAAENDPTVAIVAADSRFVVFHKCRGGEEVLTLAFFFSPFRIKGRNFSIETLVDDRAIAQDFVNGEVVSFRLSPEDYHRCHSPVNGTMSFLKHVGNEFGKVLFVANHRTTFAAPGIIDGIVPERRLQYSG